MTMGLRASSKKGTENFPKQKPGALPTAVPGFAYSVHDIDGDFYTRTLGVGADHRPDFLSDSALPSNDLAHVLRGHPQL